MPMARADVSLGEFVRQLALKFKATGIRMPFNDDQPWHELLYSFKRQPGPKPRFLEALIFDWTGPSPRSRDLAEYLNSLHRIGCLSAENPSFDRVDIDPDVQTLWQSEQQLAPDLQQYLDQAVERAKELFPVA